MKGNHNIRFWTIASIATAAFTVSIPLAAHHSFSAEFDSTKEVRISGALAILEWQNPHAWIHLTATEICERTATRGRGRGGGGEPEEEYACRTPSADEADWGFELGSPNGLMRQGWNRNSLSDGDQLTIEGTRARDGSTNANARVVTKGDGTRLFAGSSENLTP